MNNGYLEDIATFVIPFWADNFRKSKDYLHDCIKGIINQTDKNWQIIIIDDATYYNEVKDYLFLLSKQERIYIIRNSINVGAGQSRNLGIEWANKRKSPIILFNDADDISHPLRLEKVREIFKNNSKASVVYSTFNIIDENGNLIKHKDLIPSISEILDSHKNGNPPSGENAWIDIATKTGYTNLTSATSVKTEIAYMYPFPKERVSEDQHTWLRYSAGGDHFVYEDSIPSLYRIPQNVGSSSREREVDFYATKVLVDKDGFEKAIKLALSKGKIDKKQINDLLVGFYVKEAETVAREKEFSLAEKLIRDSAIIDKKKTLQFLYEKGLENKFWANLI